MTEKITTSDGFVRHAVANASFTQSVERWAWRYLAAGDVAYTGQGRGLADMFERFGNDPQRLMEDFEAWVAATVKAGHCPACRSSSPGFCTLVTGSEHLHNGPGSDCCQNAWHQAGRA